MSIYAECQANEHQVDNHNHSKHSVYDTVLEDFSIWATVKSVPRGYYSCYLTPTVLVEYVVCVSLKATRHGANSSYVLSSCH